jgi:hypothetical protein
VLEYVKDLDRAFAIPILRVAEHEGLSAKELREEPGSFHPPAGLCPAGAASAADDGVREGGRGGFRPRDDGASSVMPVL